MIDRPTDRGRIDLGGFIVGKIEKSGRRFEMLMDPEKAWEAKKLIREEIDKRLKSGAEKSRLTIDDILDNNKIDLELIFESFTVFEDLRRGKKATDGDMEAVFDTSEGMRIAGHILIEADYKGAELRTMAYLSGDKNLREVFLHLL